MSGSRKVADGGRGKSPVSLYGYFDAMLQGITTWSLAQSESYPSASIRRAKASRVSRVAAGP